MVFKLAWVTLWIPYLEDYYKQTERVVPEIVRYVHGRYGEKTRIMAAGHSLGGGLAQTAAYAACGAIDTMFAFDSSPVTKHSAADGCIEGGSPRNVYRFFEQSEILSYARVLLRMALGLRLSNPHMTEIKVHLFKGIFVRAHSMSELAIRLDHELKAGR